MGMGITGFYREALAKDFSRDFQMRVVAMGPGGGVITEKEGVYITAATLPGYSITNIPVPFMGLDFNVPGAGKFEGSSSWSVTFRADQQLNIRERLIAWQKSIFNSFPTEGEGTGQYGPKSTDTYAKLVVFDRSGSAARAIKLMGVYPVSVAPMSYNPTGNGDVVTFDVTLAYQWWMPEDSNEFVLG